MQRPTGVTIIAVLDFIGAAGLLILGLLTFAGGSFIAGLFSAAATANGATTATPAAGWMAGIGIFLGAIFLAFAIFFIFVAIGLLKLKNWARITTIVLSALGLLTNLNGFRGGMAGGIAGPIVGLAINILIIWYMLQPNVKTAFGQTAAA
jgi:hypothetical protein|nr:hypothetical protein [Candidatus Acidoferrales bacterium]